MVSWLPLALLILGIVASNCFWFMAIGNLSQSGEGRFWRIFLWSKIFTSRDNFTDEGWRYRNYALGTVLATLTYVVGWIFLGS
jgi:hypothetical protein